MQKNQDLLLPGSKSMPQENLGGFADPKRPGSNLLEVCLRRKWAVIAGLTLCIAAACVYLHLAPRIYTCTSRLFVEQNGPALLGQDAQTDAARNESYMFRQCQVIRAEPILRQALADNPAAVMRMYHGMVDPLPELLKNLSVDLGKKDEIITVELNSAYPAEAAQLLNSIVSCYEAYKSKQTRSTATEELTILQHEKDKAEQELDQRLKEIVDFKQKHGEMFFTDEKGMNILTQNLATISQQLTSARLNAISVRVQADHEVNQMLARRDIQEADQRVAGFELELEKEKQKALAINAAGAEYQKMQVEADRTTRQCDLLDARIKELNVTGNSGSMNIQVLEVAKPEDKPTQPRKTMTLLAAVAAGLFLGGGWAVVRDHLDQRIRAPDEAAHLLGLPVLGVIPQRREHRPSHRSQIGCAVDLSPTSALADAFQAMAVSLHVAWPRDNVKTLLVTSPNRNDGKSTTCSNLAIAMALGGRKVLLVDADLRRPVQHEIFGRLNAVGLSDVISNNMFVDQAIQHTDVEGLSLLACGALPPNPAEIVRGQAFSRMVKKLEEQFDLIIIDSPPILAAPDARILGAQVDVALLVIRSESSTRQDADEAVRSLRGVGTNIVGLVVNGVHQFRGGYFHEGADLPARSVPLAKRLGGNVPVEA